MRLQKKITTDEGEFELVVIKWDEFERGSCTTRNVLYEGIRRGYLVATIKQVSFMREVLDRHDAQNLAGVWILVALHSHIELCEWYGRVHVPHSASIVSGILYDSEGSGVPAFGENPNYEWGQSVGFVFLVLTK